MSGSREATTGCEARMRMWPAPYGTGSRPYPRAVADDRDQAPLPPDGLEAALRPFGESRLLPRSAYVEQSVFDWEERHFWRGGWTCVARSEDVAGVGDQRAEP